MVFISQLCLDSIFINGKLFDHGFVYSPLILKSTFLYIHIGPALIKRDFLHGPTNHENDQSTPFTLTCEGHMNFVASQPFNQNFTFILIRQLRGPKKGPALLGWVPQPQIILMLGVSVASRLIEIHYSKFSSFTLSLSIGMSIFLCVIKCTGDMLILKFQGERSVKSAKSRTEEEQD